MSQAEAKYIWWGPEASYSYILHKLFPLNAVVCSDYGIDVQLAEKYSQVFSIEKLTGVRRYASSNPNQMKNT